MEKLKCECPEEGFVPVGNEHQYLPEEKSGMNHEAGKCKGTNDIKLYKRGDEELHLCSCCWLLGDIEV